MGLYDREYYQEERAGGFSLGGRSTVVNLIIVNAVIFLANLFLGGAQDRITHFLALWGENLFEPWYWWRFLTYGFVHNPREVGHIFLNMFVLWMFGREVEALYGPRRFLGFYLLALVLGSVVWAARQWALDRTLANPAELLGASGAVTAVFILFVLHYPTRTILLFLVIPVPAWLIGILYVLGDLAGFRAAAEAGGMASVAFDVHLVGAAFALLYWQFGAAWLGRLSLPSLVSKWPKLRRPKLRIHEPTDPELPYNELDDQADAILEKVGRQGIDSLTARERRILEAYSRRMQQKRR